MKMRTEYSDLTYPFYYCKIGVIAEGRLKTMHGEILTYIRKKLDGIYYLTLMRIKCEVHITDTKSMIAAESTVRIELLQRLITDAYRFIKLGIVIPEDPTNPFSYIYGKIIGAIPDPDQSIEGERLS